MIPDKLLINLKILGKIEKNGKISKSCDGVIALETDSYIQSLKRFINSDSRRRAIHEISSIITEAFSVLNHLMNSRYLIEEKETFEYTNIIGFISLLLSELESAKLGIQNLQFTYITDLNVSSQLDIIIMKIDCVISETNKKLMNMNKMNNLNMYKND